MSIKPEITKEMQAAMQGVVPSTLSTCSIDGTPNITFISQVFYVDKKHVALSFQFMNKTWRNLQENPTATVLITNPVTFTIWKIKLRYLEMQTEGPIFDQMDMQLLAMVSMLKIKVDFAIKAALICQIESVDIVHESN